MYLISALLGLNPVLSAVLWLPFFGWYLNRWNHYGVSPYTTFSTNGPYKVGARDVYLSSGQHVICYYPIDNDEYNTKINDSSYARFRYSTAEWDESKDRQVQSYKNCYNSTGNLDKKNDFFQKYPNALFHMPEEMNMNLRIDAVENAVMSQDFGAGKLKLRALIYSHGNNGCPTGYSSVLTDYASRGMIVFAPAHTDGSCRYA